MKSKKKILLGLMAAMVIMAIGTVAVYAAGEINVAHTYLPTNVTVTWDTDKPKPEMIEVFLGTFVNNEKIGTANVRVEAIDNWKNENGKGKYLCYSMNENNEPQFYKEDVRFTHAERYEGADPINLSDEYDIDVEIIGTPFENNEVKLEGESDEQTLTKVTNRYTVNVLLADKGKYKSVEGEIKWNNVPEADRPECVKIKAVSNGKVIKEKNVCAGANWKYEFKIPAEIEKYELQAEIEGLTVKQEGNNLLITKPEVKPEAKPEAKPEEPAKAEKAPKTADEADVAMWIMLAGMSVAALTAVKKNKANN